MELTAGANLVSLLGYLGAAGALAALAFYFLVFFRNEADWHRENIEKLREIKRLVTRLIEERDSAIAALKRQVDHLERMRGTGLWVAEQESALRELRAVIKFTTPAMDDNKR